ncbi:Diaminohydroxyphosphoribosylaminopyrimidine deaminase / 5-amino-6-(5-phosphoribosylamino)uracil reductase [hydrothermal vent metagenome]|uniref:Diaminohydroxyphosphoribosylaminopyrimidine deaminase / 5-amino-6-(5-phosphoribosylamino)uracil reductase n=1 Tax=hydrothermal vent metagenome TaxID=652676 RepID=A0A3B1A0H7_9ZZZZ
MPPFSAYDHEFMSRAIRLAKKGLNTAQPNPRVGCVITKNNMIVGEGWHKKAGEAHAEINALLQAGSEAKGATVYVTLEPCCHTGKTPPCTDSLIKAGVARVVAAMQDPHDKVAGQGFEKLKQAGIEVQTGLLEEQARLLNPGFIKRMQQGLPFVRVKMAMSVDGRTAMASGESKWITGEAARHDVHQWRARSSAMLTGIGTILHDDPSLTMRLGNPVLEHAGMHTDNLQPLRVILDSELKLSATAKVIQQRGDVLVFSNSTDELKITSLEKVGVKVMYIEKDTNGLDLQAILKYLASLQINEVMVEAGANLAGSFVTADLVDELIIYMAPVLMGNNARGLFNLPLIRQMSDKIQLNIKEIRQFGEDIRIIVTLS